MGLVEHSKKQKEKAKEFNEKMEKAMTLLDKYLEDIGKEEKDLTPKEELTFKRLYDEYEKNATYVLGVNKEVLPTGGKQSKIPVRFDLIDHSALMHIFNITSNRGDEEAKISVTEYYEEAIQQLHAAATAIHIKENMDYVADLLGEAFIQVHDGIDMDTKEDSYWTLEGLSVNVLTTLATTFYEGELNGYTDNNWKKIPAISHINHALNHLYLFLQGDEEESHVPHALCRTFMALSCVLEYNAI